MPSASLRRQSAHLSRIARMVYGSVPVRPYPSRPFMSPLVVPNAAPRSPRPQPKGGQRRGY